ncbi:alpha/beta fold hydrolase [Enterococcus sp. AZ109]|uniref:alpha/beta fold hydrolase n=1 Tax=Enterococcus sp. AZ109 TaxID=2774634 RepID=UPI003F254E29
MSYFNYQGYQIYYDVLGHGEPVVLLHGNTSSSKLFQGILPLYGEFQVILLDFLGYGRSDRVEEFPTELWKDEAEQVGALIEELQLEGVHLAGTSGGAWVALNVALLLPEKVKSVTADSFDGRTLHEGFKEELLAERGAAVSTPEAAQFYEWCIGEDWLEIVEKDTDSFVRLIDQEKPLFVKALKELQVPLLLTGSKKDQMVRRDLAEEYAAIAEEVPRAQVCLFNEGTHPSIGTNAVETAEVITAFIREYS